MARFLIQKSIMKKRKILALFIIQLLFLNACNDIEEQPLEEVKINNNEKYQALLIGTFHYNNPGADVAKTKSFDILSDSSQEELEAIAEDIKTFNPTKIFVEWPYDKQIELDSLYNLYRKGLYFENDSLSDFYKKNEIFQLAFRVAKKNNLKKVIGIDYKDSEFPFDSLMTVISNAKQTNLQSEIESVINTFTADFNDKIESGATLLDLTNYLNTPKLRKMSNKFHNEIPLIAGEKGNFIGPFLTSEWYKRNLYMWSIAEKQIEVNDERIMILLGASHIATIKGFIDENEKWETIELIEINK